MAVLSVILITQEDGFFIPNIIESIGSLKQVKLKSIVILDSGGALENRKGYIVKSFGFRSLLRLFFLYACNKILNVVDSLFKYKLLKNGRSICAAAHKNNVQYYRIENINALAELVEYENRPDLIISFSAPQTFGQWLLSYPRYGVLNVHGSLLPDYRGIMPSFWALANGEKFSGATIHKMSEKIDEGEILLHERVDISNCKTVFEVIKRTKKAGGNLALQVLNLYTNNPENIPFKKNDTTKGNYYSWPTKEEIKVFHKKGYRFA